MRPGPGVGATDGLGCGTGYPPIVPGWVCEPWNVPVCPALHWTVGQHSPAFLTCEQPSGKLVTSAHLK